jgi:hypothetical protein
LYPQLEGEFSKMPQRATGASAQRVRQRKEVVENRLEELSKICAGLRMQLKSKPK